MDTLISDSAAIKNSNKLASKSFEAEIKELNVLLVSLRMYVIA